jgi:hypothetical protein
MTEQRRFYRFTYMPMGRLDRPTRLSLTRDSDAAMVLGQRLHDLGYRYAGPIINYPLPKREPRPIVVLNPDAPWRRQYRATDLILVTTRLPLDDDNVADRRGSRPSYAPLEQMLFAGPMRTPFERLCRTEVILDARTAEISEEIAARQVIMFRQNCGATYLALRSRVTGWRRFKGTGGPTAGFLVYAEHAWPGGPALLAAFGMGGTDTLVWCHLLATRYADLLCTTSFAMAEMCTGGWPERPESMDFVQDVKVEILGVAPSEPRHTTPPTPPHRSDEALEECQP